MWGVPVTAYRKGEKGHDLQGYGLFLFCRKIGQVRFDDYNMQGAVMMAYKTIAFYSKLLYNKIKNN